MSNKCTFIIPFYNEDKKRLEKIIENVQDAKGSDGIICIDDGSDSKLLYENLSRKFRGVKFLRLDKNQGKSRAVQEGLKYVMTDYVFMLDADLSRIKKAEIERAIEYATENPTVSMLILRRMNDPWFSKLIRGEILTSGERIIKTEDLKNVFKYHKPNRYQLEFAINFYLMKQKKKTYWLAYSGENTIKIKKMGVLKGLKREIAMYIDMLKFAGIILPIRSLLFFCRGNVENLSKLS